MQIFSMVSKFSAMFWVINIIFVLLEKMEIYFILKAYPNPTYFTHFA